MVRSVTLARGNVLLRRLKRSDESQWLALRRDNRAWLRPWEATAPPGKSPGSISYASFLRQERRAWRQHRGYSMVIVVDGSIVGRVSVASIQWGAECGGSVGYWIAESHAGRGVMPVAVALISEFAFQEGLHRLEIAVRPENQASLRVAQKLGFREEGIRRKYLYIDGDWRDHQVFALTADEPRIGTAWASGS